MLVEKKYVMGIDPSGSYKEGKGCTGLSVFDVTTQMFVEATELRAAAYSSPVAYWEAHCAKIEEYRRKYQGLVVSIEAFILYQTTAMSLVNSEMETCQLIGIIKYHCFRYRIPITIRPAVMVKRRWSDEILEHKRYIYKSGRHWAVFGTDCVCASDHTLDSMRHALHCAHFELDKL